MFLNCMPVTTISFHQTLWLKICLDIWNTLFKLPNFTLNQVILTWLLVYVCMIVTSRHWEFMVISTEQYIGTLYNLKWSIKSTDSPSLACNCRGMSCYSIMLHANKVILTIQFHSWLKLIIILWNVYYSKERIWMKTRNIYHKLVCNNGNAHYSDVR